MLNILVVDTAGEYGSLVKGVLMSKHFGVSVSMDLSEAREKLNTGLFDMICVDSDSPKSGSFIDETNQLVPNVPIITLSEKAREDANVFRAVLKPISLSALIRAVREGVSKLDELNYQYQHRGLVLPIEVAADKEIIKCRLTELGFKGAMIEPETMEAEPLKQFANFFTRKIGKIIASILQKEQTILKVASHLAYTEQSPDLKIKRVGLSFLNLKSEEQKILEGLLTQSA